MNGEQHNSHSPLRFFFFKSEPDLDLRFRVAGSLSGELLFLYDIASEGITVFRSLMLPFVARRRRDFLKLMLSSVYTFLTLWDLVSSVFEVSFWAEALEP